jgi:hypothetical protein
VAAEAGSDPAARILDPALRVWDLMPRGASPLKPCLWGAKSE